MEENLDKALNAILDIDIAPKHPASLVKPRIKGQGVPGLGETALEHYNKAKEYLRQGDWAGFGRELDHLENILKEISGRTTENK
jgi:hypothetical protein